MANRPDITVKNNKNLLHDWYYLPIWKKCHRQELMKLSKYKDKNVMFDMEDPNAEKVSDALDLMKIKFKTLQK